MSTPSDSEKKPGFIKKLFRGLRRILKVLLIVLTVLIIFILAGGLGLTVKYVGVPVANTLGVPLSIEKCVILPLGGYVCIEGLQVDNPDTFIEDDPATYADTPLARIGKFEADLAVLSLLSDEIRVDSLQLSGVRALYAFDLETTNVDALLRQIGIDPAAAKEAPAEEAPAEEASAEEAVAEETAPAQMKPIRLAYVSLEDNSVTIRKFVSLPIPLPPLTLHDVDNRDLIEKIETTVAPVMTAIKAGSDGIGSGMKILGDGVRGVTDGTLKVGSDGLDLTKEGLKESAETVEESAKAVREGLKSLFGK